MLCPYVSLCFHGRFGARCTCTTHLIRHHQPCIVNVCHLESAISALFLAVCLACMLHPFPCLSSCPYTRRYGSALEVEASGMLRARFAEDGKLEELDMMFDGVAVHQQIQKATGVRSCLPL